MVRYSDELVSEIQNANDIVDVISQYVTLKRSGRNFFGLCPFHKEKTPSFSVSPDKQIFHCFGCGAGGNVIHFVRKIENLDYIETLEILAERAGIQLPTINFDQDSKRQELKSKIYEINQEAAKFYHENLYKPTSKVAQEYVKKRKLDNTTLKNFLIGSAGKYNELYKYLKSKGYSENDLLAANIVVKNDNGEYIDRFRKRLIFPILDVRNRIIAFGARVLDNGLPKYINSAENLVYSKGKNLYGLNIAKNSGNRRIIIVEGYMDAVSLHQRGINNAVASLGTALTEAQGRLLMRYAEEVIISYDSDSAGQAATLRGLEILHNLGCNLRILQMEEAKDPDEYIIKYGSAGFNLLVEKAISLVEFKVKVLKQGLDIANTIDKIKFLNEIAKILASVDNKIEREIYIDKISEEYKISREAIYAEVNKLDNKEKISHNILNNSFAVPIKKTQKQEDEKQLKLEKLLIKLLINEQYNVYNQVKDKIKVDDIIIDVNKRIIEKLYLEFQNKTEIDNILGLFEDEEEISRITEIMAEDYDILEVDKGINDLIRTYYKEQLTNKRDKILEKLSSKGLKEEEMKILEAELSNIIIELAKNK